MVSKSLTFIALLLCAILAQTVTARTSKPDESGSEDEDESDVSSAEESDDESGSGSEDEGSETEDEEEEPLYQSLSCLLFEDIGCKSECSVLGSAFGYKKATGTCNEDDNVCNCQVSRDDSLASLWNAKFDSKDILQQIKKKTKLSEEVSEILDDPFQTAQEAKENLKSVLTKDQYNKLKLKNDSAAAKMKKNGKLDSAAIKKFVAEKLPATLKSADSKTLSALKLKPVLFKVLKEAKTESDEQDSDAFDELVLDVRRTENKTLGDILNEYLKKNSFKEPAKDKNEISLADTIASYVIDELVKKVNKKPAAKAGKSTAKKTATKAKKPVKKSKSKKTEDDDDDGDDDDDTSTKKVSQKNRFVLKNFDKSALKQSGPINQNWNKNGYDVRYQRSWGGDINLVWIKGADQVRLQKSSGSDVNQTWNFGNVSIRLSKSAGGDINQTWDFGNSSYRYSRSAGGYTNSNWSSGKPNKKILKMYQGLIDDWCRDNSFLIQRAYCVIYDM